MELTIFNCSDNHNNINIFNIYLHFNKIHFNLVKSDNNQYLYYDIYNKNDNIEYNILELLKQLNL